MKNEIGEVKVFEDKNQVPDAWKTTVLTEAEKHGKSDDLLKFLEVEKIASKADYETAKKGLTAAKKFIKIASETRLKITRNIDALKSEFMDFEKAIIQPPQTVVDHLEKVIKDFDEAEERKILAMYTERLRILQENGYTLSDKIVICGIYSFEAEKLRIMEDSDFYGWLDKGKEEVLRQQRLKEAEEQRQREMQSEREAIAKEREELAEMKRKMEEQMQKMSELQSEIEAQKMAAEAMHTAEPEPEPIVSTPPLDFDLPKNEPTPEPVTENVIEQKSENLQSDPLEQLRESIGMESTNFTICEKSYNQAVNDVVEMFKVAPARSKAEHIEAFLELLK